MIHAIPVQLNRRHMLFFLSITIFVVSFLMYTYFLNATILNIVGRKNVEKNIAATSIRINELEAEYRELSTDVTEELAVSLGFVESDMKVFVGASSYDGFAKLGE